MTLSKNRISRRTFLSSSAAVGAVLAAGRLPAGSTVSAHAGEVPLQNVRVSHDDFTLHGEPSLAVNPRNVRNLLGCCMVQSNTSQFIATYASFDGGATWRSNGPLPDAPTFYDVDPSVAFDPQGHGFVSAVTSSSQDLLKDGAILVWRTDDGGRTFRSPVGAFKGGSDHPWLAASPGHERIPALLHLAWFGVTGIGYSRSMDGAASFEPARALPGTSSREVGYPLMAAGPGGAVYVVFLGQAGSGGIRSPIPLLVASSQDYGATFSAPLEVLQQTAQPPNPPGGPLLGRSDPVITVSSRDGSIYVASVRYQAGADHTDIVVSRSRDRGQTWSRPSPVTSGGRPTIYFYPQLAVDHAGRLGVLSYGLVPGGIDVFLFMSEPHTMRFGAPRRVTSRPFDPRGGQNRAGSFWLGDYQGLASAPGTFHPFWTDTRMGRMEIFTATVRL